MDKQQGTTVQHMKYIQYPVIIDNGEEYEKEYIYVQLNHFAPQQKSAQHFKSTLLQ